MIISNNTVVVRTDKDSVLYFNNLLNKLEDKYPNISNSVLIKFNLLSSTDNVEIAFSKCKTSWDRNRKDYTVMLLQYNVEDGFLYYFPESSVGSIPFLNMVEFFEIILYTFLKDKCNRLTPVKLSKVLLDKFFQTLKCYSIDKSISIINAFQKLIDYSVRNEATSVTSLLVRKQLCERKGLLSDSIGKSGNYSKDIFTRFSFELRDIYLQLLSGFNKIMSSVDLSTVDDGFFRTNVLIHKHSNDFFSSDFFKLISSYNDSDVLIYLMHNFIFNPNMKLLFEQYVKVKDDDCVRQAFLVACKLYQAIDMLADHEINIYCVAPILGLKVDNLSLISFFKSSDGDKFILLMKDLNSFFENYKKIKDFTDQSLLQKALDNFEKSIEQDFDSLDDLSIYQLNDRLLKQLITIFS